MKDKKLISRSSRTSIYGFLLMLFVFCFFIPDAAAQNLPDKIRGYKVHHKDVNVKYMDDEDKAAKDISVEVDFDEPTVGGIGLTGVTLNLGGEMTVFGQSGTVDFITFQDFVVNDIDVDIDEYNKSFDFKKNDTFKLKDPIEIFVPITQAFGGIFGEVTESKEKWRVTGRVFVFGRFNKLGFKFKRVIPVDIDMLINNPLKSRR